MSHKNKEHVLDKEEVTLIFPDYRGTIVLGTHEYIAEMKWGLLAEIDAKEALAPLNKLKFIVKPFDPQDLLLRVSRALKKEN